MNSVALFSKTSPVKLFFLASLPGAISMLASALYQTIDGVFVGQFLGSTAFAAVNLAMPFVIIKILGDLCIIFAHISQCGLFQTGNLRLADSDFLGNFHLCFPSKITQINNVFFAVV